MKRAHSKLFNLGEVMRNASIAAYDINRSIQKLAKDDPTQAGKIEEAVISSLLKRLEGYGLAPLQR